MPSVQPWLRACPFAAAPRGLTRPDRTATAGLDEMKKAPRLRGLVAKLPVQQQSLLPY